MPLGLDGKALPMRRSVRAASSGIALVMVLWLLALLSVIAGSLVYSSRTELGIATNLVARAQAEAFADAGVHKAIQQLSTPVASDPDRWRGNGAVHLWQLGDAMLRITIIDEAGKVDLNQAPLPLLRALLVGHGVEEQEAEALAAAVVDWRDPDELVTPNGAEAAEYAAAGRDYGPANGQFTTIEELSQVLGVSDELYRRLEPALTVYSQRPGIDSTVAPRGVLLGMPGATPEMVDTYLDQRQAALATGLPPPPFPPAQGFSGRGNANTFSIQVIAVLRDNARFFREAVVRLTGNVKDPVVFLAWRNRAVPPEAAAAVGPTSP